MGFELPSRTVTIAFDEGHSYHGAEVEVKVNLPLGLLFRFQRIGQEGADTEELITEFAEKVIVGWNLEVGGEPVPATPEGIQLVDLQFASDLISHWVEVATNPPAPLAESSNDGSSPKGEPIATGAR